MYLTYRDAMYLAMATAKFSPDPSSQNGAVILSTNGVMIAHEYNAFPKGVAYSPERWERPLKYSFIEHAERNAIYACLRRPIGATMVCPWAACADCARAIVQSGIAHLIRFRPIEAELERWRESCELGDIILREGDVTITQVDPYSFEDIPILLRDGKDWPQ